MAATQTRPWTMKCALILTPEHILCDHSKHKTCKVSRRVSQNYQPAFAVLKMFIVILCFTIKLRKFLRICNVMLEDVEFAGLFARLREWVCSLLPMHMNLLRLRREGD